jgi:hypothetical protein
LSSTLRETESFQFLGFFLFLEELIWLLERQRGLRKTVGREHIVVADPAPSLLDGKGAGKKSFFSSENHIYKNHEKTLPGCT